ncbi:hypothetical protein [Anaerofustis stercorihominis]|uniref:hypothetical protein n=1 Tax=Anaerofustis stercorihominis TaxID=214853 RepID=UPI00214B9784|nr:hypothetical protein [Anaerofustis stercorihominis]MCR2032645.1 hypothetical protein [Anaerofustis stercorihominis]
MKNKNKIIAGALSSLLVISTFTPSIFAKSSKVTKEESVYVIADQNGNVNKKIVSDTLKNTKKGDKIEDKSNLRDIKNVKGKETFNKTFSKVIWNSEGKDITYQGTSNKKLPISVKLSYYLNGEKVSAEDIAHKSGKLKIRFDYKNTTFNNNPFMIVSGMIMDSKKISNVKVTNGKSVDEGDNTLIIGYGFPGMDESLSMKGVDIPSYFEVSADVKDFTFDGSMSYATNEIFSDIDLSDVDSLMDLTNSLSKLSSASNSLVEGSDELYKGITTLVDKSGTLTTGVDKLNKGAKKLADGSKQLKTGANDIKNGANTLSNKIDTLSTSLKTAKEGASTLKGGLNTAGSTLNQTIAYNEQVKSGIDTMISQLKSADPSNPMITQLETMSGTLDQTIKGQKQISYNLTTSSNSGGNPTLMKGASDLQSGLSQIYDGSKLLKTQGSDKIAIGANDLINKGIDPLISGSNDLSDGLNTLQKGSSQLISGINKLQKGSKQLKEGMNQFDKEGISKLVEAAGSIDNLKARLHTTIDKANDYNNFSGISDNMNGSVKFIYKTDAIE